MAEAIEETNSCEQDNDNEVRTSDWSLQLRQCYHNEKGQNPNVASDSLSEFTADGIPCEYCGTPVSFDEYESHLNQCAEAERQRVKNITDRVTNELIPCENCAVLISINDWTSHMNQCTEAEKQRIENITRRAENALIPCEYCAVLVNANDLTLHTRLCAEAEKERTENTTTRADNALIPCEYCAALVNISDLTLHTNRCVAATARNQPTANLPHATDALIPCEYCDNIFSLEYIENHQTECRRKQVASVSTFQDQEFHGFFPCPKTWNHSSPYNLSRYALEPTSDEYKFVADNFHRTLPSSQIVQVERIQNRRWYRQYDAHKEDFIEKYGNSTEQWLFHGCKSQSVDAIINRCFDRSHAVRCAVGQGIYFATDAAISFSYTQPDADNIRHMFMARVLVGKTTAGTQTTRVCPSGYDTTGGGTVFVTYHDAQAYGEYLIAFR